MDKIEKIADDIISFVPVFYKKLLKSSEGCAMSLSNLEYKVLNMIDMSGKLPISEIGKRLFISKPHMSSLIDRLIKEGKVQRIASTKDRRIINIGITEKGRKVLLGSKKNAKKIIKKNLMDLGDKDIEELQISIEKIKSIVSKLKEGSDHEKRK